MRNFDPALIVPRPPASREISMTVSTFAWSALFSGMGKRGDIRAGRRDDALHGSRIDARVLRIVVVARHDALRQRVDNDHCYGQAVVHSRSVRDFNQILFVPSRLAARIEKSTWSAMDDERADCGRALCQWNAPTRLPERPK
jgi:hypothetical protein